MDKGYQNHLANNLKRSLSLRLNPNLSKRTSIIQEIEEECKTVETGLRKLHKLRQKKFIISISSTPKGVWDSFIFLLVLYSATVIPYNVAFHLDQDKDFFFYIFDSVVDLVFFIDMVLSVFSEVVDRNNNLVNDHKFILINYLKSRFFSDLAMNFPYQIIEFTFRAEEARLLRFLKSARIFRISAKLNKLFELISRFFFVSGLTENFIMWFIVIYLFVHLTACLWGNLDEIEFSYNTWTVYYKINGQGYSSIYLASVYWVTTTIFTVGFGDIVPTSDKEKIFAICTMGIGVFFFSYIISTMSLSLNLSAKRNYHLENNLRYLQMINKKYKLPVTLFSRIEKHIKYNLETTRKDHTQFATSLSTRVSQQLIFVMNKKVVDENLFFQDKAEAFIKAVVLYLMPLKVCTDDKIFIKGDLVNEIYFLISGTAEFYSEFGVYELVESNDYFGDAEIFHKEYREFNVRAACNCELLLLENVHLLKCMNQFEEVKMSVITIALEKYDILKKKQYKNRRNIFSDEEDENAENIRYPSEASLIYS